MSREKLLRIVMLFAAVAALSNALVARAASKAELNREASRVLKVLTQKNKAARLLAEKARAVLVFPNMVKAGFMFGGQIGEGVLFKNGKPSAYYNSVAASYGFQAGVQSFGYALFFMNDAALSYLDKSEGFELVTIPEMITASRQPPASS